jgi:hypothetical protein
MRVRPLSVAVMFVTLILIVSSTASAGAKRHRMAGNGQASPWMGAYLLDGGTVDGAVWAPSQVLTTGRTYDVDMNFRWQTGQADSAWVPLLNPDGTPVLDPDGNPVMTPGMTMNDYVQDSDVTMTINGLTVWDANLHFAATDPPAVWDNPNFLTATASGSLLYSGLINPEGLRDATITRTGSRNAPDEWSLGVDMKNPPSPVPEPSTLLLLGAGALGMMAVAARRRRG